MGEKRKVTHPQSLKGREKVDPEKSKNRINNLLLCVHDPTGALLQVNVKYCYPTAKGLEKSLTGPSVSHPWLSFLLTDTGSVVLGKPRRALACEATDGVNTQELTVMLLGCTFIKICKKVQDGIQVVPNRLR